MRRVAMRAQELSFTYAGRQAPSLSELSFEIAAGSSVLVAGRTGSGKSTLLRALAGLIPHHTSGAMQGRVEVDGVDTRTATRGELARRVGFVTQSPDDQICSTTVESEVAFGLENLAVPPDAIDERIDRALASVDLQAQRHAATAQLSGGQKQRLALAAALALEPRVVVLDEPLSQLDPQSAADLLARLAALRAQGLTIVLTEHRLDDVLSLADRVILLDEGRLIAELAADNVHEMIRELPRAGLEVPAVTSLAAALNVDGARTASGLANAIRGRRRSTTGTGRSAAGTGHHEAGTGHHETGTGHHETGTGHHETGTGHHAAGSPSRALRREPTAARREAHTSEATLAGDPRTVASGRAPVCLAVADLAFAYTRSAPPVWEDLHFALHEGERVALVGPNGCGKSTLLAVLAGLLEPRNGTVHWGEDAAHRAAAEGADAAMTSHVHCGLVLQNPDLMLFCPRVDAELTFGPRHTGLSAAAAQRRGVDTAARLGLSELLHEQPLALSQGQRLRTAVAATVAMHPSVLLLDEPTTGQDRPQVERMMQALCGMRSANGGESPDPPLLHDDAPALLHDEATTADPAAATVLFATHDLYTVLRFAQRVLVLADGQLLADVAPAALVADDALLSRARLRRPAVAQITFDLGLTARTVGELLDQLRAIDECAP